MFGAKKRKQKLLETIGMIKPTSRASLKQQCLYMANLNVDKAERMYDFLVKDMTDLPDIEPASKPFIQNIGDQVNGVFAWMRENQDMLSQAADFIKGIFAKRGATPQIPQAPLPPIND